MAQLILLGIVAPIIGICLAVWALTDAWTVKDGPQHPTLLLIAISACVNVVPLVVFEFQLQWMTLAPWIGLGLTVIAIPLGLKRTEERP